jgi:glutaredoxin
MIKYLSVLICFVFFICGTANADFYKWEDEDGNVHITDYPPPTESGKNMHIHKDESGNGIPQQNDDEQEESAKDDKAKENKDPGIVLYTKNSCNDCDKAREFLKSKKRIFTEYNMDNDRKAARKRKEIDDSEDVPFAIINRNQIYGFSENVYNRALKQKP